jgi:hypothetical protein
MNDSQYNLVNHFFPFMTFSLLPIHDPIFLSLLAHLIIIKRLPIQFCAFFVLPPELLLINFIHIFTNHWLYFYFYYIDFFYKEYIMYTPSPIFLIEPVVNDLLSTIKPIRSFNFIIIFFYHWNL